VKNLNSIRNVKRAIDIEFERLVSLSENKQDLTQETRSYDAERDLTFSLRSKEEAEDYRYFPEPDLPPFHLTAKTIEELKISLPELPEARKNRFISQYGLTSYDAGQLCAEKKEADYFEELAKLSGHYKSVANWMLGPLRQYCNQHNLSYSSLPLSFTTLSALIDLVESGKVSFQNASGPLFKAVLLHPDRLPEEIALELDLMIENDENSLINWIDEVINNMPEKVK
jgi:aspartyl-tRNA(Asn)/glutamyl-tRNA(Gln) amidotransferase subunit B